MTKVFVDTNVLIYGLDKDSVHFNKAKDILTGEYELYISTKNIAEYFAVTSKLQIPNDLTWRY